VLNKLPYAVNENCGTKTLSLLSGRDERPRRDCSWRM